MKVAVRHNYGVSQAGVLVHNNPCAQKPKGGVKHNPSKKGHRNAASKKKTLKKFKKKQQKKADAAKAAREAAQKKWDALTPEQQKMLPELEP